MNELLVCMLLVTRHEVVVVVVVVWGTYSLMKIKRRATSIITLPYFLTEQFGMEPRVVDSEPFRLCEILRKNTRRSIS